MARRSSSVSSDPDRRFPVRIKIMVPQTGLGTLIAEIDAWLTSKFGLGGFGQGPATAVGMDAIAYHFAKIQDAQEFFETFESLVLATGSDAKVGDKPAT